jgi:hypothetical protein
VSSHRPLRNEINCKPEDAEHGTDQCCAELSLPKGRHRVGCPTIGAPTGLDARTSAAVPAGYQPAHIFGIH